MLRLIRWMILTALVALVVFSAACAEGLLGCVVNGALIQSQWAEQGEMLFLPSCADLTQLQLSSSKRTVYLRSDALAETVDLHQPVDLTAFFPDGPDGEGVYRLYVDEQPLGVMQSAHQAAMFLFSADPVNRGRAYVESSPYNVKYAVTADLLMVDEKGQTVYAGPLRELRGRGNTSWDWGIKKPYQIKLEEKADLLQSGDIKNVERTWVLLAESFDSTLLHNTISLSLGQELGLRGTPQFRPVDLYYDGVYCGYYLLSEKVHVKPGRLDLLDTETYLEELYPMFKEDRFYPAQKAQSVYGEYQYVPRVEVALGSKASYLIELDQYGYSVGGSWFAADGGFYELRMPSRASQADVLYVQQIVAQMIETVHAGGVHPVTGKTLGEQIDLDSLARFLLINQYAKTVDFGYTSTCFYLPDGSEKLYAGPIWDFDIAYSIRDNRPHEFGVEEYVPFEGWLAECLKIPALQEVMQKIWQEELSPLLHDVLLGTQEGKVLRPLQVLHDRTEASRRMNDMLWDYGGSYDNINYETLYDTFEQNWAFFEDYLTRRLAWMDQDIALWAGYEIEHAALELTYQTADVRSSANAVPDCDYQNFTVEEIAWSEAEGDTAWHALYTVDVTLSANEGVCFADGAQASVNGFAAEVISQDGQTLTLRFSFMGPLYEEALMDDIDYGLLYQYDYFLENYPEVIDEVGEDPELVLEEYVYFYLPEGYSAIETFDYDAYYENYQQLLDEYFMGDVMSGMEYYLGGEQGIMLGLPEPVKPEAWTTE